MKFSSYNFKDFKFYLIGGEKKSVGVSTSSYLLSKIIPSLKKLKVLDMGCGIGYMTIGALYMGAQRVIGIDISNTEKVIRNNIKINNFNSKKFSFIKSDLFSNLSGLIKFDVIIANLPQHSLPATPLAKKLRGKYGGYDGTDLIYKVLSESVYYLKPGGKYFGAVSELTNFKRTFSIANTLYNVRIHYILEKKLRKKEMEPYINDYNLLEHLKTLKKEGLIKYKGDNIKKPITYKVYFCEFILRNFKEN